MTPNNRRQRTPRVRPVCISHPWRGAAAAARSASMRILLPISVFVCLLVASCEHQAPPNSANPSVLQMRLVQDGAGSDTEQMTILHSLTDVTGTPPETLNVKKKVLLDGTSVASASVQVQSASSAPVIEVVFTEKGRKLFADVTRQSVGKRLAIVADGKLVAAPRIEAEITGGRALVSGRFSLQQATELAAKINQGGKQ